jgi:hypothetical protein
MWKRSRHPCARWQCRNHGYAGTRRVNATLQAIVQTVRRTNRLRQLLYLQISRLLGAKAGGDISYACGLGEFVPCIFFMVRSVQRLSDPARPSRETFRLRVGQRGDACSFDGWESLSGGRAGRTVNMVCARHWPLARAAGFAGHCSNLGSGHRVQAQFEAVT